ncbi:MAG: chemotaxis protein CheW [Thermodesulfobacteriota bacterium]|nr:chemotaxis protein CheW [Thermodesulfobacteriota bacterium]
MNRLADFTEKDNIIELVTFHVGKALCGMNILTVQEINKNMNITYVPQSQDYVLGVLNLRGKIVSIIDLGTKLGLSPVEFTENSRNVIVNSKNEHIGFLVDSISDVIPAELDKIESPPANIGGVQGKFFEGVFKTEDSLIGILDVEEVLKEDEEE